MKRLIRSKKGMDAAQLALVISLLAFCIVIYMILTKLLGGALE